jgi:phenylpropionate dioxygenase-like ring-hydroxylating dioxygenase large terminal subunit
MFVNLADQPRQTLPEYLGEIGELFGDLPVEKFKRTVEWTQEVPANWKCLQDASLESYHVGILHAKSASMVPTPGNPFNVFYNGCFAGPHSTYIIQTNPQWQPKGEVFKFVYASWGVIIGGTEVNIGEADGLPLAAHRGVNRLGLPNFGLRVVNLFPNTQILIFPDSYWVLQYWPLGPERTRFVLRNCGRAAPTSYLEEFAAGQMLASQRDVFSEDIAMTQSQQSGMQGGVIKRLHLSENEVAIRHFHQAVVSCLEAQPSVSLVATGVEAA